jgi:hypothetical protein
MMEKSPRTSEDIKKSLGNHNVSRYDTKRLPIPSQSLYPLNDDQNGEEDIRTTLNDVYAATPLCLE